MVDQNMALKNLSKKIYKINSFLKQGLKENNEIFFRKMCFLLKKQKIQNPIYEVKQSIELITPFCEIKSIKVKSNIASVPTQITKRRQRLFVTKFLYNAIKEKKLLFFHYKLASEIVEILSMGGNSLRILENFQKKVEMNKIFLEYKY